MNTRTPIRLGHTHLKVRNTAISERFYADVFGLKAVEHVGDSFVFMSFGEAHHDLALQSVGADAPPPKHGQVGLYHVAFEVDSPADLTRVVAAVRSKGLRPALVDHGISWAAYFNDPDGNGLEAFLDRRGRSRGEWAGVSRPLTENDITRATGERT